MVKKKYGVILLSAGYGKRLAPITLETPKVLVKIKNKPIIEYWLNFFHNLNEPPTEVLINTHYLSDKIKEYFKNKSYNFKIILSHEKVLKGSFGTIIHNKNWIKRFNKIIIIYADILFTNNLEVLINNFTKSKTVNDVIILSDIRKDVKNCGQLKFNKLGLLTIFKEKPKKIISKYANSGLYLFKSKYLIKTINEFKKKNNYKFADIAESLLPLLVEKAYVYVIKGSVVDIGTQSGLKTAQRIKFSKKLI